MLPICRLEDAKLGKVDFLIPDDLEREFRIRVAEILGGQRGSLSKAVAEAIRLWLKQTSLKKK